MKVLSLTQPWASLVAVGVKTIETRSWATPYRGPLAIHASKNIPTEVRYRILNERVRGRQHHYSGGDAQILNALYNARCRDGGYEGEGEWDMPLGAVIATTELLDVVPIHEQFCKCKPSQGVYVGIGTGGLGREVVGLYRATDGLGISRVNGTQAEHPYALAHARRDTLDNDAPFGDYRCGRWAWLLGNVIQIGPFPAKGSLGLWTWERERVDAI